MSKNKRLSLLHVNVASAQRGKSNQLTEKSVQNSNSITRAENMTPRKNVIADPAVLINRSLKQMMEIHSLNSNETQETLRGLEMGHACKLARDLRLGVGIGTGAGTGRSMIAQVLRTAKEEQQRKQLGLRISKSPKEPASTLASFWSSAKAFSASPPVSADRSGLQLGNISYKASLYNLANPGASNPDPFMGRRWLQAEEISTWGMKPCVNQNPRQL
jgi:hypothetical protein